MSKEPLQIGQSVGLERRVCEKDIESFAELSLDRNPVHFNEDFASKTIFGQRIAHGGIGMALISGALTKLMGEGNIWLSVSLKFEKPILIGALLTCSLKVKDIDQRGVATIDVEVANEEKEVLISGNVRSMRFTPKRLGATHGL